MVEAALAAEGSGPPPPELDLAHAWDRWQALPADGGLLDQPAGLLERMRVASLVYDAWKAYRKRTPGWERMTGGAWNLILSVALMLYTEGVATDDRVRVLARTEFGRRLRQTDGSNG